MTGSHSFDAQTSGGPASGRLAAGPGVNRDINRDRYLTPPAVWGDDRPLGARETTRPTGQVKIGDLIVFHADCGNAYRVGGIDRLDPGGGAADPTGRGRALIRFNCGDQAIGGCPNPAMFWDGDPVTVLQVPRLDWQRGDFILRLHVNDAYAGYLIRKQTTPPAWEIHYWDDYLERHCQIGACTQQWAAERLLATYALGLDPADAYRLALPTGDTANLTAIDRPTLDALPTLATGDHGDELKIDTGCIQIWISHGRRRWDLPGHRQLRLTDAIYMRERPDQNTDQWDTTSVWQ
ncbi:hypothetical protein [Actinomadura rupiterrae]|uniref:hypothetical protein n=1 Tax=Actinomadura rupiterrae TaxID=559627 RepID=UPI0020A23696|nr:hypothetical protein [Actinomadura rupiterrae]MCP2342039.1 hypothetical protein [Actinomadura rupiterrae]